LVYKQFLSALSFLTIIPVGRTVQNVTLENISKNMFLFPVIGFVIGLIAVLIGIFFFVFLDHYISAFLVAISLIILTGIHHTDALGDFADGVMVKGNREKKHKVMHDPQIGSAGAVAVSGYLIAMTLAISSIYSGLGLERLLIALVSAEIIAKYSMTLQAFVGKSAWKGYSSQFTIDMKSKRKMTFATIITIILLSIVCWSNPLIGIQIFIVGVICGLILLFIANKNFGGISGDVMGATNELVRLVSLISLS
jgi:adenosylcobinamide-GDP ribazoletransferase